jgi:cobalt-zinc-cadmium efflux system outer membrane protein
VPGPGQAGDLPGDVLTLDGALARARARSPAVLAARELAAGAREAARLTPRWLNPSLELRGENWASGAGVPLDAFVVLSQPLELGGRRAGRLALASAEAEVAGAAARETGQRVLADVAERYVGALRVREALDLLALQRQALGELVDQLARRVAEGVSAEADLRKFEAELARLDVEALRAGIALDAALAGLAARLSLPGLTPDRLVRPDLPAARPAPTPEAIEAALATRPDVAAARARLERARLALELERARRLPDLAVSGGFKQTSREPTGVAAVTLAVPWADRNQAGIARAAADLRSAEHELEAVTNAARAEAAAALRAAAQLRAYAAAADARLVAPAEVVRQAARASFREGAFDALRVVDAERAWLEARREAVGLALDAVLADVRARLALGEEIVP